MYTYGEIFNNILDILWEIIIVINRFFLLRCCTFIDDKHYTNILYKEGKTDSSTLLSRIKMSKYKISRIHLRGTFARYALSIFSWPFSTMNLSQNISRFQFTSLNVPFTFIISSWSREKYLNRTVINIRNLVALLNRAAIDPYLACVFINHCLNQ